MTKIVSTVCTVIILSLGSNPAFGKPIITAGPSLAYLNGYTNYELEIRYVVTDENTGFARVRGFKSRLEFPLDVSLGGIQIAVRSHPKDKRSWSTSFKLHTNLANPGNSMKDSDWGIFTGDLSQKDVYTESVSELRAVLVSLEGKRGIYHRNVFSLSLYGGVKFQHLEQDLFGVEGWWRQFDSTNSVYRDTIFFSDTGQVGYYRVRYFIPMAGLSVGLKTINGGSVDLSGALLLIFASDFDDHLRRKKTSTASGTGRGFDGSLSMYFPLGTKATGRSPSLELSGGFMTLNVATGQTQTWYGDDPLTPDFDDTGQSISGIPYEISSTQYRVSLTFSLFLK